MDKFQNMKKVELHCHLDGSIRTPLFQTLAQKEQISVPDDLESYIRAPKDCGSLKEYLERFARVAFCMQKAAYLEAVTEDVLKASEEDNVIYTEIRFAPVFSLGQGLTMESATRSVLRAMKNHEEAGGIKSRAILCMMRGIDEEKNREVIETFRTIRASKDAESLYLGGIDLAGDEASYPLALYEDLFMEAAKSGIPFTIHAGECGSVANILDAAKFGAKRIGHGIAAEQSAACRRVLKEKGIVVEMCPTSNYQTKALKAGETYPLAQFLEAGLHPMLNTDNRTVSGTTLTEEYRSVKDMFENLTEADYLKMNLMALEGAFLPEDEKALLKKKLQER